MAIKAGQYLINPALVGAAGGVAVGGVMAGKHGTDSVDFKNYATTGAQWGFGLGAAGLAISAIGKFKTSKFTTPSLSHLTDTDKANMTQEQIAALEQLSKNMGP